MALVRNIDRSPQHLCKSGPSPMDLLGGATSNTATLFANFVSRVTTAQPMFPTFRLPFSLAERIERTVRCDFL